MEALRLGAPGRRRTAEGPRGGSFTISRRPLAAAALGAAGLAAGLGHVRAHTTPAATPTIHVGRGGSRLRLAWPGHPSWILEAAAFAGSPRFESKGDAAWLCNARLPGTDLTADFECRLVRASSGTWSIRFEFPALGATCIANLDAWLRGRPATGHSGARGTRIRIGGRGRLDLLGHAALAFRGPWDLTVHAPVAADLAAARVQGTSTEFALAPPGTHSVLRAEHRWRTITTIARAADTAWHPPAGQTSGRFVVDADPFAIETRVEATEDDMAAAYAAAVVEADPARGRLWYVPASDLTSGGSPARFRIDAHRHAVAFDDRGVHQEAVVGALAPEPAWVRLGALAVRVAGGVAAAPFTWVGGSGGPPRVMFEPLLLGAAAPIAGAVAEIGVPPPGTRVSVRYGATRASALVSAPPPGLGASILVGERSHIALTGVSVSVLRPEDLLALTFTFQGMVLRTAAGEPPVLERADASAAAYVTVTFPPQHVGEESFWEAQGAPAPPPPPVQARLAGPSRLVFSIPQGTDVLPYTLDALLDWSGWNLLVAPTASPPPLLLTLPARFLGASAPERWTLPSTASGVRYAPIGASALRRLPETVGPVRRATLRAPTAGLAVAAAYLDAYAGGGSSTQAPSAAPAYGTIVPYGAAGASGLVAVSAAHVVAPPGDLETAIEAPYRLILSPSAYAGFAHAAQPVRHTAASGGVRTELWHSRLGVRLQGGGGQWVVDENDDAAYFRTLRAIWSPDYAADPAAGAAGPFRMSLDAATRNQIVHLTADQGPGTYAVPLQAGRLMLSAMGAWLDVQGNWPGGALNVASWSHRATGGRDQHVRVTYRGYLFPFGHRASVIQVTERQLGPDGAGTAAYLRTYQYLVVRQPVRTYAADGRRGRQFPFAAVELTTLYTPQLDAADPNQPFWVQVGGADFPFSVIGTDLEGRRVHLASALAFIPELAAVQSAALQPLAAAYANAPRATVDAGGQTLAMAAPGVPGDTALAVNTLTFGAEVGAQSEALPADQPRFFPMVAGAGARLTAVEAMGAQPGAVDLALSAEYLDSGFDPSANAGEVFLVLAQPADAAFTDTQSLGGLVAPNLALTALSRRFGAVGGTPAAFAAGTFDPSQLFSSAATLLGGIALRDLLAPLSFSGADARVPSLQSRIAYVKNAQGVEDPGLGIAGVETVWSWSPRLQSAGAFQAASAAGAPLGLTAVILAPLDGSPPTYRVDGRLTGFSIDLLPSSEFLGVDFDALAFHAESGQKLSLQPSISGVRFLGPLAFVSALQDFLGSGALGSGPSLDVGPQGVTAGFGLAVPTVAVGVFSVQNIALSAQLNLPFDGSPARLRFGFSSQAHPFQLSVGPFGGGGYFALALGLDGVESLQAALEFGGALSLDLGVASGGVHVLAGVYYGMDPSGATLTGYLRAGGNLEVLGIVNISAEFYLALSYESAGNRVWGEASLTVSVSVLFFSASVSLDVRREFAGSAPDPTFTDLMGPDALLPPGAANYWVLYAEAFA